MASVRRFQDLECHKLAVEVRREILRFVRRPEVRRDFKYVEQIRDAARSAPRNIAEGYSRFNPTEILKYLSYSKASLDETKNHITDAEECGYVSNDEAARIIALIHRTLGAIARWRAYLESPAARAFYAKYQARRRASPQNQSNAPQPPRTTNQNDEPEPKNQNQEPRTRTVEPEP